MGDSSQTRQPQPPESPSLSLRVASQVKQGIFVGKEVGKKRKEDIDRTIGSMEGSGAEDSVI